jgi:hypothetical protein
MPLISKSKARQMGIPKKSLQTVLFNKSAFDVRTAKAWLRKHNMVNSYWRKTANQIRFMNVPDIKDASFFAKKITPDITFVFQEY